MILIESFIKLIFFFLVCSIVFVGGNFSKANASQVTLAWEASSSSEVSKYNLYYLECALNEECSTSDVDKDSLELYPIEISELEDSSDPYCTIYNLSDSHKYAFVLTAGTDSGQESEFSNEVNFTPTAASDDTDTSDTTDSDNQPPEVDAGQDQSVALSTGNTILTGTVNDDGLPEGGTLTYTWTQDSGPGQANLLNSSETTTQVTFTLPGTYTFTLTANDSELTASDAVSIEVYQSDSNTDDSNDDQSDDSTDSTTDDSTTPSGETTIIDNSDTNNTSSEGTWETSVGPNPYSEDSVFGRNGATFSWHYISPTAGTYKVSIYWTYHPTRATSVPISIESENGVEEVTVAQREEENAAKWISLGEFEFVAGESYEIKITAPNEGYFKTTSADAVKFEPVQSGTTDTTTQAGAELIVDNSDQQNVISTGTWQISDGVNPHSQNSVYAMDSNSATFTWSFVSQNTGTHDVSIWWTYYENRSADVPLTVTSEEGTTELSLNQQENASTWVSLGEYKFVAGQTYDITINGTQNADESVCADAIKITTLSE